MCIRDSTNGESRTDVIKVAKGHPLYIDPKTVDFLFNPNELVKRGKPTSGLPISKEQEDAIRAKLIKLIKSE